MENLKYFLNILKLHLQDPKINLGIKVVAVSGGLVLLVKSCLKYEKSKRRKNYPKDVVILHQFPRGFRCPSPSPFALKLETWLRMAKISYQNDFSLEFSSKSQIPFITLNGIDYADSQFCIEFLSKTLNKNLNEHLDEKQLAISWCVLKTCEESLRWCVVIHRFVYAKTLADAGLPNVLRLIMTPIVKKRSNTQGYGRHSKEEMYEIGKADLKAINDIIGDNKFIFGDKVSDVDASLFGMLTQIMFHDVGPLNDYLMNSCPNIVRQIQGVKSEYWPDWYENIKNK